MQVDEVAPTVWTCGGLDLSAQLLPCLALIYVPHGVLDEAARMLYVRLVHQAFEEALPAHEKGQLMTSVMLHEVEDGTWAANGAIWRLPDFARAAGCEHLQSLVVDWRSLGSNKAAMGVAV